MSFGLPMWGTSFSSGSRAFPKMFYGSGGGQQDDSAMYAMMAQEQSQANALQRYQIRSDNMQTQQQHQWTLDAQAAADAKAAQDKQDAITQFQNDLASATAGARQYAGSKEAQLGLAGGNDYGLNQNFNDLLQSTLSGIGSQQTGNAGALVSGQALYDQANSQTLAAERNKLQQQYNQIFTPNYVSNNINASNLFGSAESDALTNQLSTAQAALDRAHARGQLNDDGYAYANQQLQSQAAAAKAKISSAGQTVLDNYTSSLNDALGGYKTAIQNWNYGDPTDVSSYGDQVQKMLDTDKANALGDFQNAIAGQTYFDPTSLISSAGTYQGTTGGTGTTTGTGTGTTGTAASSSAVPLATKPVSGTLQNQGIV